MQDNLFIRDLGDGLILRHAASADADALADFNAKIHSESEAEGPRVAAWTRDLLTRPHPTFTPGDFTIVEETATGRIISSCNLISQQWDYEGIHFGVGRVELVGTLAEFRGRGLIRAQFEEIHKWSAERGELVQAITGIPYFYRQFGYEMGLELGGGHVGFEPLIPRLKDGESEPFLLRPAVEADIPFVLEVYSHGRQRSLVTTHRDETILRYEMFGKSEQNVNRTEFRIIETVDHEAVGYLTHPWFNWNLGLSLFEFELKPGVSWLEVSPSVYRYALETGKEYARRDNEPLESKSGVAFWLGTAHPAYSVLRDRLPRVRPSYAWYVRVADLAGFIRLIAPALEKRLAESYLPGYSGSLHYNFYRDGLKLVFEKGKLKEAESYKPAPGMKSDIGFPNLTFLQLLFGYRSLDELRLAYVDCYSESEDAHVVTATLFPRKPSLVTGIV
jgi:GNAT superfamily N-acetyltransferase